jgi:glycine betaine/proline transport system substrate-binding protein
VSLSLKRYFAIFAAMLAMMVVVAACNGDDDADDVEVDDEVTDVVDDAETDDEVAVVDDEDDAVVDEEDDAVVDEEDDAVVDEEDDAVVDEEDDAVVDEEDDAVVDEEDDAVVDEEDDAVANGLGEGQPIEIGLIEWAEGIAITYLWAEILEEHGYDVTVTSLDVAPLYTGLAQGDMDVFLDAWLPTTHAEYWEEYGDDIEEIGTWYDEALLALTVPQYVVDEHGIESLEDLQDNADLFDSTITGIDAGAGMMGIAANELMPTYGLDDWTLTESSEAAMLTELQSAIEAEEPIVVTLWEPHWAYAEWELHNLEDPEMVWGEPDSLQVLGRTGFSEDFPELAQALENFHLEPQDIGELMDYVTVQAEPGEEQEYARQWMDDGGQDLVDEWIN